MSIPGRQLGPFLKIHADLGLKMEPELLSPHVHIQGKIMPAWVNT